MLQRLVSAVVLAVLFLGSLAQADSTFTIKGRVIDERGKPIASNVYLIADPRSDQQAYLIDKTISTNKSGEFEFKPVPEPTSNLMYSIVACNSRKGMGSHFTRYSEILQMMRNSPNRQYEVTICSYPLATYDGRVLDLEGKPVPDAEVTLFDIRYISNSALEVLYANKAMKSAKTTTDKKGAYQLKGIPADSYLRTKAAKPGYGLLRDYFAKRIVLAPAGSLSGRVLDEKNNPLSGVTVNADLWPGKTPALSSYLAEKQAITSENGTFTLKDLPPAHYMITLRESPKLFAKMVEAECKVGQTIAAPDMIASKGFSISGHVSDIDTGQPVEGARLDLYTPDNYPYPSCETDKNGYYQIPAMPGVLTFISYNGGNPLYEIYDPAHKMPTKMTVAGPLENIDIKLKQKKATGVETKETISCILLDESGKPVINARIYEEFSDSKGRFKMQVSPYAKVDNELTLTVLHDARRLGLITALDPADLLKDPLVLEVKPLQSLKIAVEDQNGRPLNNACVATVRLIKERPASSIRLTDYAPPVRATQKEGTCILNHLIWGGRYNLEITLKGYWPSVTAPFIVGEGMDKTIKVVMQSANRTQLGRVVDMSGKAITGARIRATCGLLDAQDREPFAVTDANGEFALEDLPDSDVEIQIRVGNNFIARAIAQKTSQYLRIEADTSGH